ncbi:winged helix-turn-helix transcriptional regulator [Filifactor villosus]|uniref:Winged helix-turn-helix transcriptional regulator n=1 Tax=Filifactor villosus TaxID=29374 RepID=A0ABV9QIK5_9FIRM
MEKLYGNCPFLATQKVLQGKWAIIILHQLSEGTKRFGELEKRIPEVTRSVLTRQLRQLEKDRLIDRRVYAEVPPRVEYSLSEIGRRFERVLSEIEVFGEQYIREIQNRERTTADRR